MTGILIPRLFHWIWFGPKPLPPQYRCWIDGWLELHPGWDHRLWTDANRPTLINEAQFEAATSFSQKATIARYELIYRYGGVYLDTDTECLRGIEPLLESVQAFAVKGGPHTIEASPIGAVPGHPWLAEVIARLPRAMETGWGNLHQAGPMFLTGVTKGRSDVTILGQQLFAAMPVDEAQRSEAYSIHHGERSWSVASDQRYEAKLRQMVSEDIEPIVPPGALFVLVDKGKGVVVGGGRRFVPFPEQDGQWAGYPVDDAAAIAELVRLRQTGAQYIVFPAPMFYWLDAYAGFRDYLYAETRCALSNERVLLFDLRDDRARR